MAQKTIVTLVDDLTGEVAENISTVEFALDGRAYELDLTDETARSYTMRCRSMLRQLERLVDGVAAVRGQAEPLKTLGTPLATAARR